MLFIRSLLFYIAWIGWILLVGPSLLFVIFLPRDVAWRIAVFWARGVIWLLKVICGVTHELRGMEHFQEGAVVFASKHQSAWETLVYVLFTERPAYVLKKELLRIPFFGQFLMLMEMIAIDRSKGEQALKKLVSKALKITNEGRAVVIFPEGTRTPPGETRRYKKRGITALYNKLAVPVVPVALNSGCYWGRNAFIKHPGKIVMEFQPPIEPGLDDATFLKRLTEAIEKPSQKLYEEAQAALGKAGASDHHSYMDAA